MFKDSRIKYYIFGAHSRGQTMGMYLKTLYTEWTFLGYLYDNEEDNSEEIDGDRVLFLPDSLGSAAEAKLESDATVYIATRGVYHDQIKSKLEKYGFKKIVPVDAELDIELRNRFVPEYFRAHGWEYSKIEKVLACLQTDDGLESMKEAEIRNDQSLENLSVYVVRSAFDSALSFDPPLRPFEKYIQAGCALTGKRLENCSVFDNTGNSISGRNKQFCELTALYWIWKNSEENVVGLEHYRRRFILPDGWRKVFDAQKDESNESGCADVILPVPLYVHPTLKENYCDRHISSIWDCMMEELAVIHPDCVESAKVFFENTGCYSPCNMMVARKETFNEMCEWLFPVLFAVAERCGSLDDPYQNRYPGFLSERLITFYFHYMRNKLKVVYADKTFLG